MPTSSQSEATKIAAAGFATVYDPLKPYLEALDQFLLGQVDALEPEVREQARYVMGHSGKRLRPMLVAYSGWTREDAEPDEALVRLGAIIELVHLATLVHDDILDEADTRHRQQTAARKFGPASAVLIGDVLFSHALKLASDFPTTAVCRAVAGATARVCAGEVAQTYGRGKVNDDRDFYFRVIRLKTAELFEVSCRLGAAVAGYPDAFCEAAGRYGLHLGVAYQIFDDLADVYGEESAIGKTLGTDLDKGKFTLPLLCLLDRLPQDERGRLIADFEAKKPDTSEQFARQLQSYPVFEEVASTFDASLNCAVASLEPHRALPPVEPLLKLAALVRSQLERIRD